MTWRNQQRTVTIFRLLWSSWNHVFCLMLVADMHRLALRWPRFGYRRVAALLVQEGWRLNVKRVHRLWKEHGLKIRRKTRKRRRMCTSANACHRRKPRCKDHVWSYDFVAERTERGGQMKLLSVVDEFTRECLTIQVARAFRGPDVVAVLIAHVRQRAH